MCLNHLQYFAGLWKWFKSAMGCLKSRISCRFSRNSWQSMTFRCARWYMSCLVINMICRKLCAHRLSNTTEILRRSRPRWTLRPKALRLFALICLTCETSLYQFDCWIGNMLTLQIFCSWRERKLPYMYMPSSEPQILRFPLQTRISRWLLNNRGAWFPVLSFIALTYFSSWKRPCRLYAEASTKPSGRCSSFLIVEKIAIPRS